MVPVNYIVAWLSRKFIRLKLYVIVSISNIALLLLLGVRFQRAPDTLDDFYLSNIIRTPDVSSAHLSLENLLQFCSYQKCNPILISVCLWCGNKNQTSLYVNGFSRLSSFTAHLNIPLHPNRPYLSYTHTFRLTCAWVYRYIMILCALYSYILFYPWLYVAAASLRVLYTLVQLYNMLHIHYKTHHMCVYIVEHHWKHVNTYATIFLPFSETYVHTKTIHAHPCNRALYAVRGARFYGTWITWNLY